MVDLDARPPSTPFAEHVGLLAVRSMEAINISLLTLSKGRVGGSIFGEPVILLTTSGRRTGERHTKPLLAIDDRGSWIVVASRGGTTQHPHWYRNLVAWTEQRLNDSGEPLARPAVWHRGAPEPVPVDVEELSGHLRDEWWRRLVGVYPKFESYQGRANQRTIPVLRLTPH